MLSMKNIQRLIMANMPITDASLEALNKRENMQWIRQRISALKAQLTAEDHKVIKCYESGILAIKPPYDIIALIAEREALRAEINELEQSLDTLGGVSNGTDI